MSSNPTVEAILRSIQRQEFLKTKLMIEQWESHNEVYNNNNTCWIHNLCRTKSGDSATHIASRYGNLDILKYLLEEKKANIEQANLDGKTPLHDASQFSHLNVVKYLLNQGANVNAIKKSDWTPLMLACTKQDLSVVQTLLQFGGDSIFRNKDGWNSLHIASREGNITIVKALLSQTPELSDEKRHQLLHCTSKNGRKPLHTAVMHGHVEVVKFLLSNTTVEEVNAVDNCGTTAVMESCRFGFVALLDILVKEHRVDLTQCNRGGLNCLHIAAEAGKTDIIQSLVNSYGMDVNCATVSGMTAMHWAAKEGQLNCMKVLMKLGGSLTKTDSSGRTCLGIARDLKNSKIMESFQELCDEPSKS